MAPNETTMGFSGDRNSICELLHEGAERRSMVPSGNGAHCSDELGVQGPEACENGKGDLHEHGVQGPMSLMKEKFVHGVRGPMSQKMEWIKVQVLGSQNSVNASEELGAGRGELACEKRGHAGAVWIQHGTLPVAMSGDSNYGAFMDEVRREGQWCNQWSSELAMQNSSYDIGNESFEPYMPWRSVWQP